MSDESAVLFAENLLEDYQKCSSTIPYNDDDYYEHWKNEGTISEKGWCVGHIHDNFLLVCLYNYDSAFIIDHSFYHVQVSTLFLSPFYRSIRMF